MNPCWNLLIPVDREAIFLSSVDNMRPPTATLSAFARQRRGTAGPIRVTAREPELPYPFRSRSPFRAMPKKRNCIVCDKPTAKKPVRYRAARFCSKQCKITYVRRLRSKLSRKRKQSS